MANKVVNAVEDAVTTLLDRAPRGLARVLVALMPPAGAALYGRDRLVMLKKRWVG